MGFYEGNMRQNHSGAAVYFRRAANKGDRDGLSNLAVSYDNGWVEGHPPDKVRNNKVVELKCIFHHFMGNSHPVYG